MLSVTIGCKDKKEAQMIVDILLDKKLIACANLIPISSAYWWKGKKESGEEVLVSAKTIEGKFKAIEKEVKKHHSYDVPLITAHEEEATKEIDDWLHEVVE